MQLTRYIVCICMYPHNITGFLPLHVAHLLLLSLLFTVGLCIPKGSLQYFPTVVYKNLNTINQLALVSKQLKNYALRLRHFYYMQVHKLYIYMYLECSHPKLNHDNIIEALMMAVIALRV